MIEFRKARAEDLAQMIALLADDPLGAGREQASAGGDVAPAYLAAFAKLDADPDEMLIVADRGGEIIGLMQLSILYGLARGGAVRGQIEGVRVAASARGLGIGRQMFDFAHAEARKRGAKLVQLTSDKTREGAHAFYDALGYVASHEGYKLAL